MICLHAMVQLCTCAKVLLVEATGMCALQCVAEGFVSHALRRYFPSKRVKLNM